MRGIILKLDIDGLKVRPVFGTLLLATVLLMHACSWNAYTNVDLEGSAGANYAGKASTRVNPERGDNKTLMILSLSGGGSRAAYLSANIMLELQKLGLLQEVDAISAVSGGALAAAYYSVSENTDGRVGRDYRRWDERTVRKQMSKNFIGRWFGAWFYPHNIARYWFTAFDRTDIMAKTFADQLFDKSGWGRDYKLSELNPERPYLVLNSTVATGRIESIDNAQSFLPVAGEDGEVIQFGQPFRFTDKYFQHIGSDIEDYSLARAVMASGTFPAVFNYMTLRDFSTADSQLEPQYVHLFDGGTNDNQGLGGVAEILEDSQGFDYDKLVVILIDAYTGQAGVSGTEADTRGLLDFIVDTNFVDATDSLLTTIRKQRIEDFPKTVFKEHSEGSGRQGVYYHIKLQDIENQEIRQNAEKVKTNFTLSKDDATALDNAAREIARDNRCLARIRQLINGASVPTGQCSTGDYTGYK